jgi:hypothetical protein
VKCTSIYLFDKKKKKSIKGFNHITFSFFKESTTFFIRSDLPRFGKLLLFRSVLDDWFSLTDFLEREEKYSVSPLAHLHIAKMLFI